MSTSPDAVSAHPDPKASNTPIPATPIEIIPVPFEADEPTAGIVFWWSNILRGFQLRIYHVQSESSQPQILHQARIYLNRELVEADARLLAKQYGLPIYEIEVPQMGGHQLNDPTPQV